MPEDSVPNEVCAKCGYNLVGLSDKRCRQCGHVFRSGEYYCRVPYPLFLALALVPIHALTLVAVGTLYASQNQTNGPFEGILYVMRYVLDKPGAWFYVNIDDPNQLVSFVGSLLITAPIVACNSILWGFMIALVIWGVRILRNQRKLRAEIESYRESENP